MPRITIMTLLLLSAGAPLAGQTTSPITVVGYGSDPRSCGSEVVRRAATPDEVARYTDCLRTTLGTAPRRTQAARTVIYSMSGRLREQTTSATALPISIVSAVRNESHLSSFNVGTSTRNANPSFQAIFGFADLAEFDAWYASRAAQDLHRTIDAAAIPDGVEVNLIMNRAPAVEEEIALPFVEVERDLSFEEEIAVPFVEIERDLSSSVIER